VKAFEKWVSLVRGRPRDEAEENVTADAISDGSYQIDDRDYIQRPAVDLGALDREIQGRLDRVRRKDGGR
jgi:hypothetical protein